MSNYFGKQPSSRPIRSQTLNYTGSGTVVSSGLTSETWQLRVFSQVSGYWSLFESTSTVPTTAPPSGTQMPAVVPIAANVLGEYIAVSPSLIFSFSSTSTSSGFVSLVEMSYLSSPKITKETANIWQKKRDLIALNDRLLRLGK